MWNSFFRQDPICRHPQHHFVGCACLLEFPSGSGGASPNPCACANDPKGTEGANLPGIFWSEGGNIREINKENLEFYFLQPTKSANWKQSSIAGGKFRAWSLAQDACRTFLCVGWLRKLEIWMTVFFGQPCCIWRCCVLVCQGISNPPCQWNQVKQPGQVVGRASDRIWGQGGGSSCAEARPGQFDCKGCFIFHGILMGLVAFFNLCHLK